MSNEIARYDDITPGALEAVVAAGDLSKLNATQRVQYYRARCDAAGLDWRTKPFDYLSLSGKLVLYPNKSATEQLAENRNLQAEIVSREVIDGDIYEVWMRVRDSVNSRYTDDVGAVSVGGLRGEALANARMKAVTKARRRAILAHCGMVMTDETEVESIPGARTITVDVETGEVLEPATAKAPAAPMDMKKRGSRQHFAWLTEHGIDKADRELGHYLIAWALDETGETFTSRADLTAEQWELVNRNLGELQPSAVRQLVEDFREKQRFAATVVSNDPDADPFADVQEGGDTTLIDVPVTQGAVGAISR